MGSPEYEQTCEGCGGPFEAVEETSLCPPCEERSPINSYSTGLERYRAYLKHVEECRTKYPQRPHGQICLNVLYQFDAEAANQLRGTPLGPFCADYVARGEFKMWLRARWGCVE